MNQKFNPFAYRSKTPKIVPAGVVAGVVAEPIFPVTPKITGNPTPNKKQKVTPIQIKKILTNNYVCSKLIKKPVEVQAGKIYESDTEPVDDLSSDESEIEKSLFEIPTTEAVQIDHSSGNIHDENIEISSDSEDFKPDSPTEPGLQNPNQIHISDLEMSASSDEETEIYSPFGHKQSHLKTLTNDELIEIIHRHGFFEPKRKTKANLIKQILSGEDPTEFKNFRLSKQQTLNRLLYAGVLQNPASMNPCLLQAVQNRIVEIRDQASLRQVIFREKCQVCDLGGRYDKFTSREGGFNDNLSDLGKLRISRMSKVEIEAYFIRISSIVFHFYYFQKLNKKLKNIKNETLRSYGPLPSFDSSRLQPRR